MNACKHVYKCAWALGTHVGVGDDEVKEAVDDGHGREARQLHLLHLRLLIVRLFVFPTMWLVGGWKKKKQKPGSVGHHQTRPQQTYLEVVEGLRADGGPQAFHHAVRHAARHLADGVGRDGRGLVGAALAVELFVMFGVVGVLVGWLV